jgi:hypothetical protein
VTNLDSDSERSLDSNPEICHSKQVRKQHTLQRNNPENSKQMIPENEMRSHSPNFHIHVSGSDLYIPTIDLLILLQENM